LTNKLLFFYALITWANGNCPAAFKRSLHW
jgi:hypothetical protein